MLGLILKHFGVRLVVKPQNINEDIRLNARKIAECVKILASRKAVSASETNKGLVVAADTLVVLGSSILGKPCSKEEAIKMLFKLSRREHKVYTGVAIFYKAKCLSTFYEMTKVRFRKLSEDEILSYVNSGSPMDKAGAYGIQDDFGATFVERIIGDYFNVVGLPVSRTYLALREILKTDNV